MRILKHKEFRRLMVGKFISMFGSNMLQIALSWYVLAITGSATIFSSMLAIAIIPRLLMSPFAGVVGDWFDRKKMIVGIDLFNGILLLAYGVYYMVNGDLSLPLIYGLVIILEVSEIFFGSAMSAVVPSLVEKDHLLEANKVRTIINQLSVTLTPMLGSLVYDTVGLSVLLIADGISFIVSAVMEMIIRIPKINKKPDKVSFENFKKDYVEGLRLIKEKKFLRLIISFGVVMNFALSPLFSVGIVFIAMFILKVPMIQYGTFIMVVSFGNLMGPMLLSLVMKRNTVGPLLIKAFTVVTLMIGGIAILVSPPVLGLFKGHMIPLIILGVLSFITAAMASMINVLIGTLFDQMVPLEYMGRTATTMQLGVLIAMPFGQLLMGLGIDHLPIYVMTLIVTGIVGLIVLRFKTPFYNLEDYSTQLKASA